MVHGRIPSSSSLCRRYRAEGLTAGLQTDMEYLVALNAFCVQLHEFCLLFQRELLCRHELPAGDASAELASRFCETLILCPTSEAARSCIRRDLGGALSFLIAADGVLRRIRTQRFQFPTKCPIHQTKFYLLACAVEELVNLKDRHRTPQSTPLYAGKVPALPF